MTVLRVLGIRLNGTSLRSAEGVQLGNLCSAAGVAGVWTGAFHEEGQELCHLSSLYRSYVIPTCIRRSCRYVTLALSLFGKITTSIGPFWMWKVTDGDSLATAFVESNYHT